MRRTARTGSDRKRTIRRILGTADAAGGVVDSSTRRTGEPVAAVFGYANSILTVFNELKPTHVIAAWDAAAPSFRKERDERYKATRVSAPDDLVPQFDRVRQLLDAFHIPLVEMP